MGSIDIPDFLKEKMKQKVQANKKPVDEIEVPTFLKKNEDGINDSTNVLPKPTSQSPLPENDFSFNDPFGINKTTVVVADKVVPVPLTPAEQINANQMLTFSKRGNYKKGEQLAVIKLPEQLFNNTDKEELQKLSEKYSVENPIAKIAEFAGVEPRVSVQPELSPRPFVAEMTASTNLENILQAKIYTKKNKIISENVGNSRKAYSEDEELNSLQNELNSVQRLKKKAAAELTIEGENQIEAVVRTDQSGNLLNKTFNRLMAIMPQTATQGMLAVSQETEDRINTLPAQFVTGLNYIKNAEPVVYERISKNLTDGLPISESQVASITQQGIQLEQARLQRQLQRKEIEPTDYNEKILELNEVGRKNLLDNKETLRAFISDGVAEIGDAVGKAKNPDFNAASVASNYLFGNTWNYSDKEIKDYAEKFAEDNGISPQDARVQDAIKYLQDNEGVMIMQNSIAKSGGIRELFKGAAEPIRNLSSSIEDLAKSSNDVYAESQSQGNVRASEKRLKAEDTGVRGIVNDVVNGTGQFATQAGIAYLTSGLVGSAGKVLLGRAGTAAVEGDIALADMSVKDIIGSKLLNTKDGLATFITSYAQVYDSNLKNALSYTSDNALAKRAAAINSSIEGATELFLSPLEIARGIAAKFSSKGVTQDLLKVLSDKELLANPNRLKDFLSTTLKAVGGVAKVAGSEIGEEEVTQIADYVTNLYLNPNSDSFQNRDLQKELAVTAYQTGLSMAIPSLLNGVGAANANTFSKGSLLIAAQNRQTLIDGLNEDLALHNIDQEEYNSKALIINTAHNANANLPVKENNEKLNTDEKADYIYSLTAEAVLNKKIDLSKDEAEKIVLEKKIQEQRDFRTKILTGNSISQPIITENVETINKDKANDGQQQKNEANPSSPQNTGEPSIAGQQPSENGTQTGVKENSGAVITEAAPTTSAIELLKEARDNKKLGVFANMGDTEAIKMIAQQAQNLTQDGKVYEGADAQEANAMSYSSTVNQFGEPLVKAAIESYPVQQPSSTVSSEVEKNIVSFNMDNGEKVDVDLNNLEIKKNGDVDLTDDKKWNQFEIFSGKNKLGYIDVKKKGDDVKIALSHIFEKGEYDKENKNDKSFIKVLIKTLKDIFVSPFKGNVVLDSNRGKGIGKSAYREMAKLLRDEYGKKLISDTSRSDSAEAMWKSFEQNGEAKIIGDPKSKNRYDYYYEFILKETEAPKSENKPIQNEAARLITFDDYNNKILSMAETMTDSSFDWRLNIPEMSQEQRQKAVEDIRNGKDSIAANKLKAVIQDWYDKGEIELNRGRGNNAERQTFPVNEWFAEPLTESELSDAEKMDEDLAKLISEEGITLDNIDNLKNIFNGFPYSQADFNNIKNYLSTQGQSNASNQSVSTASNTQEAVTPATQSNKARDSGTSVKEPKVGKFEQRARQIADKINKSELPSFLQTPSHLKDVQTKGVTAESLKKALADAVISVGKLLDAGVDLKDALKQGADKIIEHILTDYPAGANIKADYEKQVRDGFENYYTENSKEEPKQAKSTKLTDVEKGVIQEVLNKPINAREFPTFFDMNQQGVQQTAKTQGEGQERTPLDGTYVKAHLEDLRSISLNNAVILQDALGKDWKEKVITFFEENPNAGNIAQVSGLMNVINTDLYNEIAKSKNGTKITTLKDLQDRADRITYDTSRSASLALNQRRMYQDFGQGQSVADILSNIILTPEQQATKAGVQEALKQKFTDTELNKKKPKKTTKPKTNTTKKTTKATKQDSTVKKDLISKGQIAAQQTDANGNVTTVTLKDKINQANDALKGFKC